MRQELRDRRASCVNSEYWDCPPHYHGLLDVPTRTFKDFCDRLVQWVNKTNIQPYPLAPVVLWEAPNIVLSIEDKRHESDRVKFGRSLLKPEMTRDTMMQAVTYFLNNIERYNRAYVSTPEVSLSYTKNTISPGDYTKWRYTVSACMFKHNDEFFSMLRCYNELWSKGKSAPTVDLVFDAKDGDVNVEKTAQAVLHAARIGFWPDDMVYPMAEWLAKQKKIIKRAQKKPINTTGLGEFETLRIGGFYRVGKPGNKYYRYGQVGAGGKNWSVVDAATVANPGADVGVLFECGNMLHLFVEHDQIWVLHRQLNGDYWRHGSHADPGSWHKIDQDDTWAEIRIAKAIDVFFKKGK